VEGRIAVPTITPEVQLLILCARTAMVENQMMAVRSLAQNDLNWDELVKRAKKHGVTSILYWNLNAICPELVPSDVLLFLRQHFQSNAVRAHLLTQELIQLTKAAAVHGVSLIPFKGPTLAVMAYGNLLLRDFRDMDLIVAKETILEAYKILESQGYKSLQSAQRHLSNDLSSEHYHNFEKAYGTVRVDLQWVMAGGDFSFQLDRMPIWQNLQPLQIQDTQVMSLAPEDLLLILCVHGSKHVWEEMKWVCDVAELVGSQQKMDWGRVLMLAREWRCQRMLFLGLSLAQILFDIKLPDFLSQKIDSDLVVATLSRNIRQSLIARVNTIDKNDYQAYYYCLKDRWHDRWRYGIHLCRWDSSVITTDLPWFQAQRSLFVLNQALQPIRVVVRKLKELLNLKKTVASWLEGVSG
jgi:hypothetical protein